MFWAGGNSLAKALWQERFCSVCDCGRKPAWLQRSGKRGSMVLGEADHTESLEGRFKGLVFILIGMGNSSRVFKQGSRQDPMRILKKSFWLT